jgi:hypothetical protein
MPHVTPFTGRKWREMNKFITLSMKWMEHCPMMSSRDNASRE